MNVELNEAYRRAQVSLAELKAAVRTVLEHAPEDGLTNAQIGRSLGIYAGHVGHEGHISRTILAMLESEGVAEQDRGTRCWRLRTHLGSTSEEER
jgi:hypothetical protein